MRVRDLALPCALAAIAACQTEGVDPPWDPSSIREHRLPIVNGSPTNGFEAVPMILAHDGANIIGSCTGSLISPRVVLTAAHCVDENVGAAGFLVYFGSVADPEQDPYFLGMREAITSAYHASWNPNDVLAGYDIGFLTLDAPAPVAPIPFNRAALTAGHIGQPVQLVGWGVTQGGGSDSGLKRHAQSQLFDFDPLLVQVGDGVTGTCSGDSGGPAFMTIGGRLVVMGITSFGDESCVQTSLSTRVDVFAGFIDDYVCDADPAACGAPTQPPPPGGGAAGGEEEDDDGLCSVSVGGGRGPEGWLIVAALAAAAWLGSRRDRGERATRRG